MIGILSVPTDCADEPIFPGFAKVLSEPEWKDLRPHIFGAAIIAALACHVAIILVWARGLSASGLSVAAQSHREVARIAVLLTVGSATLGGLAAVGHYFRIPGAISWTFLVPIATSLAKNTQMFALMARELVSGATRDLLFVVGPIVAAAGLALVTIPVPTPKGDRRISPLAFGVQPFMVTFAVSYLFQLVLSALWELPVSETVRAQITAVSTFRRTHGIYFETLSLALGVVVWAKIMFARDQIARAFGSTADLAHRELTSPWSRFIPLSVLCYCGLQCFWYVGMMPLSAVGLKAPAWSLTVGLAIAWVIRLVTGLMTCTDASGKTEIVAEVVGPLAIAETQFVLSASGIESTAIDATITTIHPFATVCGGEVGVLVGASQAESARSILRSLFDGRQDPLARVIER